MPVASWNNEAMWYRLSAIFLISSALAGFIGQAMAARIWDGYYLFTDYLISDLGMTQCDQIRDNFGPRYVCSPGHDWFNYATVLSGVLLALGAVLLLLAGAGAARRDTVAGYRAVGLLLALAGIAVAVVGFYPHDVNAAVHGIAAISQAVAMWCAMIIGIRAGTAAPSRGFIPMLHGGSRGLSIMLLAASLLGFVGLISLGASGVLPGFFERLSFDVLSVWTILLGRALWTVPTWRTAEQNRRRRRNELDARQQERDDALRKAVEDLDSKQPNRADQA